jgi:nucleotide-binding universal stress UspA family protein
MKILLAVDDSQFVDGLIEKGFQQMRREGVEVLVLHVKNWNNFLSGPFPADGLQPMLTAHQISTLMAEEEKRSDALVKMAADKLRSAGFAVSTSVREGDAKRVVLECAKEWKADLIVVGSHGRGWAHSFLLGSVSDAIARYAKCSVEIVRVREPAGAKQ